MGRRGGYGIGKEVDDGRGWWLEGEVEKGRWLVERRGEEEYSGGEVVVKGGGEGDGHKEEGRGGVG